MYVQIMNLTLANEIHIKLFEVRGWVVCMTLTTINILIYGIKYVPLYTISLVDVYIESGNIDN
jgi:hypothetical protein